MSTSTLASSTPPRRALPRPSTSYYAPRTTHRAPRNAHHAPRTAHCAPPHHAPPHHLTTSPPHHAPPHHLTTSPRTTSPRTTSPRTAHRSPRTAQRAPRTAHRAPRTTHQESLVSPLYLWEDQPPPTTAEERLSYLNNSLCGPATQLSQLEAEESSAWAREEAGIPVWVRPPAPATSQIAQIAAHSGTQRAVSSNARVRHAPGAAPDGPEHQPAHEAAVPRLDVLRLDVLRLDERHVASQQQRLLAFVSAALADEDMLAFRSLLTFGSGVAPAEPEEVARTAADKERLLFHLSVLRMLRLMAADGMYLPDYILAPLEWPNQGEQRGRGRVSGGGAGTGHGADTVEAIEAILEGLAPIRALEAKLSSVLQVQWWS